MKPKKKQKNQEIEMATRVQILDRAVCISPRADALGEEYEIIHYLWVR